MKDLDAIVFVPVPEWGENMAACVRIYGEGCRNLDEMWAKANADRGAKLRKYLAGRPK